MTSKEIIENNILISEFMGWKKHPDYKNCSINKDKTRTLPFWVYYNMEIPNDEFGYHHSYDWLIPVVEKISNIKLKFGRINTKIVTLSREPYCRMDSKGVSFRNSAGYGHNNTLLDATYKTVVDFIKWYNKNN